MASQWLLPQLEDLSTHHPEINLKIFTTDRNIEPDEQIDLTVRRGKRNWVRRNCWYFSDEIVFPICSPAYLTSSPPLRTGQDLSNHRLLHLSEPFRNRIGWEEWLHTVGINDIKIPAGLVFNDYQLVLQAATAGQGIAMGWSFTAQLLLQQKLLLKPLDLTHRTNNAFFILAREQGEVSPETAQVRDWLLERSVDLRSS